VLPDDPTAAMVIVGDFVPGAVDTPLEAGTGYDVFTFPSINDSVPSVVTSGDLFILFNDNDATQAFFNYLASPESAEIWAARGGFSSPNKMLDTSVYPDELTQATAGAIGAAEAFAFDLSDLQPASFGATEGQGLWKLFQDLIQNPDDIQSIQEQMEQAAAAAYK
jgi:alpha-glucoside transport system substrate-binding protein